MFLDKRLKTTFPCTSISGTIKDKRAVQESTYRVLGTVHLFLCQKLEVGLSRKRAKKSVLEKNDLFRGKISIFKICVE